MLKTGKFLLASLALGFLLPLAAAQNPVELRMTWYDDGNEGQVQY